MNLLTQLKIAMTTGQSGARLALKSLRRPLLPLSEAIVRAGRATGEGVLEVTEISEKPGRGLTANVAGRALKITSRKQFGRELPAEVALLPPLAGGLECVVIIDGHYAATYRFRDEPRAEGAAFIGHLGGKHQIERAMLLSGDRESEVKYLAGRVGIQNVLADKSPEEKLEIVQAETALRKTIYVGDGINDAPDLRAATWALPLAKTVMSRPRPPAP